MDQTGSSSHHDWGILPSRDLLQVPVWLWFFRPNNIPQQWYTPPQTPTSSVQIIYPGGGCIIWGGGYVGIHGIYDKRIEKWTGSIRFPFVRFLLKSISFPHFGQIRYCKIPFIYKRRKWSYFQAWNQMISESGVFVNDFWHFPHLPTIHPKQNSK